MRQRTTRGLVYGEFVGLCYAAGKVNHDKVAAADRPYIGAWHLQYDPIRKGYVIEEVTEEGVCWPLGFERRPAGEMMRTMRFAAAVLESIRIDNLVQRQYDQIQKAIAALKPDIENVGEWMFKQRR